MQVKGFAISDKRGRSVKLSSFYPFIKGISSSKFDEILFERYKVPLILLTFQRLGVFEVNGVVSFVLFW